MRAEYCVQAPTPAPALQVSLCTGMWISVDNVHGCCSAKVVSSSRAVSCSIVEKWLASVVRLCGESSEAVTGMLSGHRLAAVRLVRGG